MVLFQSRVPVKRKPQDCRDLVSSPFRLVKVGHLIIKNKLKPCAKFKELHGLTTKSIIAEKAADYALENQPKDLHIFNPELEIMECYLVVMPLLPNQKEYYDLTQQVPVGGVDLTSLRNLIKPGNEKAHLLKLFKDFISTFDTEDYQNTLKAQIFNQDYQLRLKAAGGNFNLSGGAYIITGCVIVLGTRPTKKVKKASLVLPFSLSLILTSALASLVALAGIEILTILV